MEGYMLFLKTNENSTIKNNQMITNWNDKAHDPEDKDDVSVHWKQHGLIFV